MKTYVDRMLGVLMEYEFEPQQSFSPIFSSTAG